jgi:hypothetical protein
MNNLILPVKIAPITPELLEWFRANAGTMRLGFDGERYGHCWFSGDKFHWDVSRHNKTPEFILPDGLPDPSAAVEVFEAVVFREVGSKLVQLPGSFDEDDQVIIMRTPLEHGKVTQEGEK